jgi:hypothetical protein
MFWLLNMAPNLSTLNDQFGAQHSTAQHSTALRGKKLGLKYSRKSSKKSISFVIKYVAYLWGQKLGLKLPEIQKKNFQFCQI